MKGVTNLRVRDEGCRESVIPHQLAHQIDIKYD